MLKVVSADEVWHARTLLRWQAGRSCSLSLADCLSFEIMEAEEIDTAFALDRHFRERGLKTAALEED